MSDVPNSPDTSVPKSKTEAPTSGVTEAALAKKTGSGNLKQEQLDFVMLQCQYFAVHGRLISMAEAVEDYFFDEAEFLDLMSDPKVQAAIAEQGVTIKQHEVAQLTDTAKVLESGAVGPEDKPLPSAHQWRTKALQPLQLLVANTMLDLVDTRSQKKKLQDLGVSTMLYNLWLKDPIFQTFLQERAEAMLGENQHEAHLALLDKVRMGDMKAIQYYNEMTGRYAPASSTNSGTTIALDFKNLMIRVLEIINDEVEGDTAVRIAERLRGIIGATSTAGELMRASASLEAEPIDVPMIAEVRELSPKLQALMESGEGYE